MHKKNKEKEIAMLQLFSDKSENTFKLKGFPEMPCANFISMNLSNCRLHLQPAQIYVRQSVEIAPMKGAVLTSARASVFEGKDGKFKICTYKCSSNITVDEHLKDEGYQRIPIGSCDNLGAQWIRIDIGSKKWGSTYRVIIGYDKFQSEKFNIHYDGKFDVFYCDRIFVSNLEQVLFHKGDDSLFIKSYGAYDRFKYNPIICQAYSIYGCNALELHSCEWKEGFGNTLYY